jgi:uncharacterized protein (DUF1697 family)
MTRYVALLRGVNVGGHRRVPMAELRAVLTGLGLRDVSTYLASGNAVFSSDLDAEALERAVHSAILERMSVGTRVLVRSAAEMAQVVADNPWPDRATEVTQLHAVFLTAEPADVPDLSHFLPDELEVHGRVAYVWYANGAGRSKLQLTMPGVQGTARNWRTVLALAEMTAAPRP